MTIDEYLQRIQKRYKTGISREHSYRGDLQTLLESMLDNVLVTNEPAGRRTISSPAGMCRWAISRRRISGMAT